MSQVVSITESDTAQHRPARPRDLAPASEPRKLGRLATRAHRVLDEREVVFATEFAEHRNATVAYRASHITQGMTLAALRKAAYRMSCDPAVLRYVNELLDEAAAEAVVSVAKLLASDRALVEAYEAHADIITQHVHECCRYCHGDGHKFQWVDLDEYLKALEAADAENDNRRERKLAPKALPTDEGGYGFVRAAEPHINCPKCEGRGTPAVYFADTTKLTGPARLLVKGVKQGANGQLEILMHDVDKAKDRLYRAAGAFGDDAASVARGAAMGAAAGAAAAGQLAKRIDEMTEDEARKAYLTLV